MAFKSGIDFLPEMTFQPELAFQPKMAFLPEILFSNLKWLEMAFFK
jgi:hypothetical protein